MTKEQKKKCAAIINSANVAAERTELDQGAGGDNLVIMPILLTMTISLGKVFDVSLDEASAKTVLVLAASASQMLVEWDLGIGHVINATTDVGMTETLGWVIANEFGEGLLG